MDLVLKDPECNWLTQDLNAVQIPTDKKHRRIVFYPCRNTTLLNVAAIFDERHNANTEIGKKTLPYLFLGVFFSTLWLTGFYFNYTTDPEATVPTKRVIDTFHDFHPRYLHIIKRYATTIRIWPLQHADPYPTWVNGKTCLVGDAAHPMLPRTSHSLSY